MGPIIIDGILAIFSLFVIAQIVIPIMIDKQIFWLFRKSSLEKKRQEVLRRKEQAEERLQIAKMEVETNKLEVRAAIAASIALDEEITSLEQSENKDLKL